MAVNYCSIIRFDAENYPFDRLVLQAVQDRLVKKSPSKRIEDLSLLHQAVEPEELPEIFATIYDVFATDKFQRHYDALCADLVQSCFDGKASFQRTPSARIQMPGQISVNYHTDEWYGHGHNVQIFWLPLVQVAGANSIFVADEETSLRLTREIRETQKSIVEMNKLARNVAKPLEMKFGEVFFFNSHILHGTELNNTGRSRVSFDFRMLRDGEDRGLKDESFFVRPRGRVAQISAKTKTGAMYIGKYLGLTKVISQKYQILLCNRYASEQHIAAHIGETELSGFDHHPTLWNLITGSYAGSFTDLIMFSLLLLPQEPDRRSKLLEEISRRHLTLHFVAEDLVAPPDRVADVEENYRKAASS